MVTCRSVFRHGMRRAIRQPSAAARLGSLRPLQHVLHRTLGALELLCVAGAHHSVSAGWSGYGKLAWPNDVLGIRVT
jgi:hypothetical protein